MLDSDRRAIVDRSTVFAAHLDADLDRLVAALKDGQGGLRSPAGTAGGGHGKGGHADPTFTAATGDWIDPAVEDLDRLDQLVSDAGKLLAEADNIRLRWLDPQSYTLAARGDDGCENCARYDLYEEALATGTVGGRLTSAMRLGRWCFAFVTDAGVLPVDWQVEDHHAGKRVKREATTLTKADLDVDHRLTVVLTTHHPRNTLADAIGDTSRALHAAGLTVATVKRSRTGRNKS